MVQGIAMDLRVALKTLKAWARVAEGNGVQRRKRLRTLNEAGENEGRQGLEEEEEQGG